ncbi:hypothetical protein APX70_06595 [Pseudomonas syringae pv. maculicola]|uniref:Uncharacterized protein n=1 Tax=Pseudomonas syringae pv. maculicola TaxID=59511 RepID=A0A3M2ZSQ0_PSEYM|nr:hypothetical protein APX70_06595 [Pseudomonas syringae pv. maculicola]
MAYRRNVGIFLISLGQPRETNPTLGADGVVTVDMANLGVKGT